MERISHSKNLRTTTLYKKDFMSLTYLGKIKNLFVYYEQEMSGDIKEYFIYGIDRKIESDTRRVTCIFELTLRSHYDVFDGYCVDMSLVDKRYQGFGIMPIVYRFVMKKLKIKLVAGSMQSPGGRRIWVKLNQMKDVGVYGVTPRSKCLYYMEENDDGDELEVMAKNLKAYNTYRNFIMFAQCE